MGLEALRRIQAGKETTRGTAVAATAKWMGMMLEAQLGDRTIVQPEDERGSLAGAFRSYTPSQLWRTRLTGELTYEDAILLCAMGIKGGVTPTTPGTNSRLWTYAPSLTAANNPDTFTLEFGDDTQEYEAEYVFADALEISGAVDEALKFSCGLVGRQLTASTFTAALADRTVESALAQRTKLYMDDSGGTIGASQKTATLVSWTWRLPAHFVAKQHQDGNLYFSAHGEVRMKPQLTIVAEFNAGVATLRTKYTGETRQLVRLQSTGANIEVSHDKQLTIDGAYKILSFDRLDSRAGANTVQLVLEGEYDSTYGKLFEIAVKNTVTAIP